MKDLEKGHLLPDAKDGGSAGGHYGTDGPKTEAGGPSRYEGKGTVERAVSQVQSSVLTCHNICYDVQVKGQGCCARPEPKRILNNIDAMFRPGMNAIMGPTGCGKSSLLDVLAGRKDPKGLSGDLLIDGSPPPENFKCMVGYVVQEDIVKGTLTVRENLQFSAALRLPSHIKKAEREARVDQVVLELGLTRCADTKVGTEFIRGVSGGEKKRCNIGMELIIEPPVLFLDEPTTGLDASTAVAVLMCLRSMAENGRTIVFSIHQPRYSIYRLFDSIVLLCQGETIFHGPNADALTYFESIGYTCESYNNPPDFFLDIINGDSSAMTQSAEYDNNGKDNLALEIVEGGGTEQSLAQKYRGSAWYSKIKAELSSIKQELEDRKRAGTLQLTKRVEFVTSFQTQFNLLCGRIAKDLIRSPQGSIIYLIVMVLTAVVIGLLYSESGKVPAAALQNRFGAFFFMSIHLTYDSVTLGEILIAERPIFIHENLSGFYRVSAFFLSKVFCEMLPLYLVTAILFSAITYFMIGLQPGADHFFIYMLNVFIVGMASRGFTFFISSSVQTVGIANLLQIVIYSAMMLFGGLLLNTGSIPIWLRWLRYLSFARYATNAFAINEMKGQFYCSNATTCESGDAFLQWQDIPYETVMDLWWNEIILIIFAVFFFVLSYVQLRRMNKLR